MFDTFPKSIDFARYRVNTTPSNSKFYKSSNQSVITGKFGLAGFYFEETTISKSGI